MATISRISSNASNSLVVSRLLQKQADLHNKEIQVASEKISQTYSGVSLNAERLVNMENERNLLDRYTTTNTTFNIRIEMTKTVVSGIQLDGEVSPTGGIREIIDDFREHLITYDSGVKIYDATMTAAQLDDLQERATNIQQRAFEALTSMKNYLNESANSQFLFSGARTDTQPVDLETTSLTAFQTKYDGDSRLYPFTRDAHVDTDLTTSAATTGALTIATGPPGTITAANATGLGAIPVGSLVTLDDGTNAGRTVTVTNNTGAVITFSGTADYAGTAVNPPNPVPINVIGGGTAIVEVSVPGDIVGAADTTTLTVASYYNGDRESLTQRTDTFASFDFDINAADPAFEKAIRAMGMIAQGAWGAAAAPAAGNIAQHSDRVAESLWLLDAASSLNTTGTPPFGTADTTTANKNNIEQMELDLGFWEVTIADSVTRHEQLISFFDDQVAEIENVDTLEVITELLDDSRALEASYQALSRIRQLSLSSFL